MTKAHGGAGLAYNPGMLRVHAPLVAVLALAACQTPAKPQESAPTPAPATKVAEAGPPAATPTPPTPAPDAAPATAAPSQEPGPPGDVAADARPLYYDRPIAAADLEGRTLRELALMRNTIYARIGQKFRKQWLSDYFSAQPWYKPADSVDEGTLSELDLKNAEAIVDYENTFDAPKLRGLREALNERMRAEKMTAEDAIEFQLIATKLGEWEGGDEIAQEERSPLEDPDRLEQLLTVDSLADFSLRDLRLLRNTIYARRGRPFRSTLLQDYFANMSWYSADDAYSDARLTAIDRKNIRVIKSVEEDNGGPITDWGHKVDEGWFYGA